MDRTIPQQLVAAFQAGRKVDLHHVLQHELMDIPISIANCDGSLRTGSKAILADVITRDGVCPAEVKVDQSNSCLIIDGQAVVVGKPAQQWRIQGGILVTRNPPPPAMHFFNQAVTPLLAPTSTATTFATFGNPP